MSDFRLFQEGFKTGDLHSIVRRMQMRSRQRARMRLRNLQAMRTKPCSLCGHEHGPPFDYCWAPKGWKEGDPVLTGATRRVGVLVPDLNHGAIDAAKRAADGTIYDRGSTPWLRFAITTYLEAVATPEPRRHDAISKCWCGEFHTPAEAQRESGTAARPPECPRCHHPAHWEMCREPKEGAPPGQDPEYGGQTMCACRYVG